MNILGYAQEILKNTRLECPINVPLIKTKKQITQLEDISDVTYIRYSGRYKKVLPMVDIQELMKNSALVELEAISTRLSICLEEREKYYKMEIKLDV